MTILKKNLTNISEFENFISDEPKRQFFLNEMSFALPYVSSLIKSDTKSILEVGCGPGLLLAQVKKNFPMLKLSGIEPASYEWSFFSNTLDKLSKIYKLNIFRDVYENYKENDKFDLIYLINVFEHLPNHGHFLKFVQEHLSPSGVCLILCPNYSFPYEPHFKIPIILNKKITYFLFKNKIKNYEEKNNCFDLWENLNFVNSNSLSQDAANNKLNITFNQKILRDMINRLADDKEFFNRQKGLAWVAQFMMKTGLLKIFEYPFMFRFNPYLMAVISLKD